MTEEPEPADPTQALQERITELDGLLGELGALTDELRGQAEPDDPAR